MSTASQGRDDLPDREIDAQAAAMKDQLRKDVELWLRARNNTSPRNAVAPSAPVTRRCPPKPVTRVRDSKPAALAVEPADSRSNDVVRWRHDSGLHPVHGQPKAK
jgi:hypothetical protein